MLILLPPSEGKADGDPADRPAVPVDLRALSLPELTRARTRVLSALVTLCRPVTRRAAAATVLGLSPNQHDEVRRNAGLRDAPTAPAGEVYRGVLYEALDLASLGAPAYEMMARSILIFSGLWGAVRIEDRIPAYRCSIGVTLPGIGGLGPFWRAAVPPAITRAAGDQLIVDLRSGAYAPMWTPTGEVAARTVTIRVLHERVVAGRLARTVVSHFNKATKGRLVRALALAGAEPGTPAELVAALRDAKYTVEEHDRLPGRAGQLDVVVAEI